MRVMLGVHATSTAKLLAVAAQLLREGRPGEAVVPLRRAAALLPDNAGVQHDLGLACLETGRVEDAIVAFRHAIALHPRYTDAFFRLGVALEKQGDARAAIAAYDRATLLLPSFTEAWFRAGALVYTLGHRKEAIGCFRRASSSGPKTGFGKLGAARALLAEERDAEAEVALRRLLALDPGNAMAHDLLGNLLAEAGRFDDARDCFATALAHAPLMAGSYYDLVRCRKITSDDGDLQARMTAALATPGLDSAQRLRLHLALGKAADDLGDCALAMAQFDAADAVRRGPAAFDSAGFDRQIDRLIATFTPELIAQAPMLGCDDETPLPIIGMPRSGTTLLEQIVSSHGDVAAGGELNFWNERGAAWNREGGAETMAAFLKQAAADYLGVLRAVGSKAARVTDKMPFNFLWAGLIHLAFPRATIIHCRRSPIDTALSIHQTHFNPNLAFPTGGQELVAYFDSYRRLAAHWQRVLPPGRLIEVDYESLTSVPEQVIRRVLTGCGLSWDESCLHPERNPRAVKTPSKWQARQPIYRQSVERWRRYEPWLGHLRALLDDKDKVTPR